MRLLFQRISPSYRSLDDPPCGSFGMAQFGPAKAEIRPVILRGSFSRYLAIRRTRSPNFTNLKLLQTVQPPVDTLISYLLFEGAENGGFSIAGTIREPRQRGLRKNEGGRTGPRRY